MFLKNFLEPNDDTVDASVSLQFVVDKMSTEKLHYVIILKDKKPIGIITERDVVRLFKEKVEFDSPVVDYAVKNIITLHGARLIEYALSVMVDNNIRKIIVINSKDEYIGCVEQEKIVFRYEENLNEAEFTIHQLLNGTNQAVVIDEDASLKEALDIMTEKNLTAFLVGDWNNPKGIISESDIIKLAQKNIDQELSVKNFMSSPIIKISLRSTIREMIALMKENKIRRTVVYDDEYRNHHIINSKDLANSIKGNYIKFLESKLFDVRDTFNAISDYVIELIDIDNEQIIYWANGITKLDFNVNIDDKITKIIPEKMWKGILKKLFTQGVVLETICIEGRYYNLKGHHGTITEDNIIKLFLNDVTENTVLTKKLQKQNEMQKKLLFEQAKMAQMGEMIANIAHQWRQPLSMISTSSSGLKIQKDLDLLTDEHFNESLDNITSSVKYLSQTIDIFRNFVKEEKVLKEVVLQDRIRISLSIIKATLKHNHIKLIENIGDVEPIYIQLVVGELDQVLINILNNAKDILVKKKISEPFIKITLEQKEPNWVTIIIEDNGEGIPDDIHSKIYDEYFTSKTNEEGTGLGLYMSRKIVTESLKGNLYSKNTDHGAKFFIELPL